MTAKYYQLKEGEEAGIYPGLGIIEHGRTYQVYGDHQHTLVKGDARFKFVPAPKDQPDGSVTEPERLAVEAAKAAAPVSKGKE